MPVANEKAAGSRERLKIGCCEPNKRQSDGAWMGQVPVIGSNPKDNFMDSGMSISLIGIVVIAGAALLLGIAMVALVLFLTLGGGRQDGPRND